MSCLRVDGADDPGDDFVHGIRIKRFDETRGLVLQPSLDVEAADLIADGDPVGVVPCDRDREAHVPDKRAAAGDGHRHRNAQRVDLARGDHHETVPVFHFPSGDGVGIDPEHVAAVRHVAADHHPISRPTGSPSMASATSAFNCAMNSLPCSSSLSV